MDAQQDDTEGGRKPQDNRRTESIFKDFKEKMSQLSIFDTAKNDNQPLAARMRPRNFNEFVGQKHLVGEGKVLAAQALEADRGIQREKA